MAYLFYTHYINITGLVCRILSMLAKENVYWLFANISDKKRLLKLFLKRKKMTLLA